MTFCLAMKVKDGLVGVADTRVTSGSECITARYGEDELAAVSTWWQERLRQSMRELPIEWMQPLLSQLDERLAAGMPSSRDSTASVDAIGVASK